MKTFEIIVFSLVVQLPYLILFLYPFRTRLRFSKPVTCLLLLAVSALRILFNLWSSQQPDPGAARFPAFLFYSLCCPLFIKAHMGKSMFTMLMLANISNFISTATKCLQGLVLPELVGIPFHWSYTLLLMGTQVVVLVPMFFFLKHIFSDAVMQKSAPTAWRYLWLIPLTFYMVWFRNFYYSAEGYEVLALRPRHVLFSMLINGGAVLMYYLIARLIREHTHNQQLREREHLHSMQHTQYGFLQDRIDEARRSSHDLRQHLNVISAYLQTQKYQEAEAYIARYRKTIPETSPVLFCENYAINALLQYFSGYAKMIGCGFSAGLQLPQNVGIPDEVLTVVLGNLLENATEACVNEGGGAIVSVRGKKDDTSVFFKIVNTCSRKPKTDGEGRYLSSKRSGYGIGLASVQNTVTEYGGMMKASWADGTFTVSVMLNIPDNKEDPI